MMEELKRRQIPAFGQWDYCDDLPITQYFDSAWEAGLIRGHSFREDQDRDLFKVTAPAAKQGKEEEEQQRKQCRVYDVITTQQNQKQQQSKPRRPTRPPKAVDEDLYKIPPELLHQKPKRKRMLSSLVSACLCLNCIS